MPASYKSISCCFSRATASDLGRPDADAAFRHVTTSCSCGKQPTPERRVASEVVASQRPADAQEEPQVLDERHCRSQAGSRFARS
jgi:hypothetical protein